MRTRPIFAAGFAVAVSAASSGFGACGGQVAGGSIGDGATDANTTVHGDAATDSASGDAGTIPYSVTCSGPGDCVLEALSCCGACASATASSFTAVERGQESIFSTYECPTAEPCAPCTAPFQDLNIEAFCQSGVCEVADVRTDAVSTCSVDSDCIPRAGSCCECPIPPGPNAVVAIRGDQKDAYAAQVCAPGEVCPSCAAHYQVTASCDQASHHCVVSGG
jgi:hypothetical protein